MKPRPYNFVDAQEMHRKYPNTFEVPTKRQLNTLVPTQYVKVCHNDERFWVRLTEIEGDTLTGTVANDLVCDQPFSDGDTITFEKRHVYDVMPKDNERTLPPGYRG